MTNAPRGKQVSPFLLGELRVDPCDVLGRHVFDATDSNAASVPIPLCLVRTWPRERILELAPCNWKQTLEQPETQQKLAANLFRRAALSLPS